MLKLFWGPYFENLWATADTLVDPTLECHSSQRMTLYLLNPQAS